MLRRALLSLLLPLPLAAAEPYDPSDPGFWVMKYEIPDTYCRILITLGTDDPASIVKMLPSDCEDASDPSSVRKRCRIDQNEAERLAKRLRGKGSLLQYDANCSAAQGFPELDYKLENLESEWATLSAEAESYPATAGLLSVQLETLRRLIARRDRARRASLLLTIPADAERWRPGYRSFPSARSDEQPQRASPWTRVSRPACSQSDVLMLGFSARSADERARIQQRIDLLGEAIAFSECPAIRVLSRLPIAEIHRAVAEIPGLGDFNYIRREPSADFIPDDVKFTSLSSEVDGIISSHDDVPHILWLLKGELRRLEKTAIDLQSIRSGCLVEVQFR